MEAGACCTRQPGVERTEGTEVREEVIGRGTGNEPPRCPHQREEKVNDGALKSYKLWRGG